MAVDVNIFSENFAKICATLGWKCHSSAVTINSAGLNCCYTFFFALFYECNMDILQMVYRSVKCSHKQ